MTGGISKHIDIQTDRDEKPQIPLPLLTPLYPYLPTHTLPHTGVPHLHPRKYSFQFARHMKSGEGRGA